MVELAGLFLFVGWIIIVGGMLMIDHRVNKSLKIQTETKTFIANIDKNMVIMAKKQDETNKLLKEFLDNLSQE